MESRERDPDSVPVSAEVPAQEDTASAPTEDVNSRKRSREPDDEEADIKDDALPIQNEDENPAKRSRNDEGLAGDENETSLAGAGSTTADNAHDDDAPKLSKNQLRKQRRQQKFEDRREHRKQQRKDKRHEKSARKREEREAHAQDLVKILGIDKTEALRQVEQQEKQQNRKSGKVCRPVPVAVIIDCDFEKYMRENELVSLAGQITRSYSMNRMGSYTAHLVVSSWGGKLKERFETVLKAHHHQWRGVTFVEGDFVEGGRKAWEIMVSPKGGKTCPALGEEPAKKETEMTGKVDDIAAASDTGEDRAPDHKHEAPAFSTDSIVYLSADSPNTLDKLEPNTSYVIGGLVDRNREKYLCQRRAEGKGIRTAKLPIGEYLQMSSRKVLATNHVVEIMSKWLETGDWAQAFMEVIPKRKGGELKGGEEDEKDEHDATSTSAAEQAVVDVVGDIENVDKQENSAVEPES